MRAPVISSRQRSRVARSARTNSSGDPRRSRGRALARGPRARQQLDVAHVRDRRHVARRPPSGRRIDDRVRNLSAPSPVAADASTASRCADRWSSTRPADRSCWRRRPGAASALAQEPSIIVVERSRSIEHDDATSATSAARRARAMPSASTGSRRRARRRYRQRHRHAADVDGFGSAGRASFPATGVTIARPAPASALKRLDLPRSACRR